MDIHPHQAAHPKMNRAAQDDDLREFLTFRLGAESYGIEILKVQEIRGYEAPTAIANAPSFIKGVINLRGVIVPILDLTSSSSWHRPATTSSPS